MVGDHRKGSTVCFGVKSEERTFYTHADLMKSTTTTKQNKIRETDRQRNRDRDRHREMDRQTDRDRETQRKMDAIVKVNQLITVIKTDHHTRVLSVRCQAWNIPHHNPGAAVYKHTVTLSVSIETNEL